MAVCQHAVISHQLQACSATLPLSLSNGCLAAGFRLNTAEVLQLPQVAHQQCCSNMHRMCSHIVAVVALMLLHQLCSSLLLDGTCEGLAVCSRAVQCRHVHFNFDISQAALCIPCMW